MILWFCVTEQMSELIFQWQWSITIYRLEKKFTLLTKREFIIITQLVRGGSGGIKLYSCSSSGTGLNYYNILMVNNGM